MTDTPHQPQEWGFARLETLEAENKRLIAEVQASRKAEAEVKRKGEMSEQEAVEIVIKGLHAEVERLRAEIQRRKEAQCASCKAIEALEQRGEK